MYAKILQSQCYEHCLKLENSLKELSAGNKSLNCFPIIVGRKPNTCGKIFTTKENTMNNLPIVSIIYFI